MEYNICGKEWNTIFLLNLIIFSPFLRCPKLLKAILTLFPPVFSPLHFAKKKKKKTLRACSQWYKLVSCIRFGIFRIFYRSVEDYSPRARKVFVTPTSAGKKTLRNETPISTEARAYSVKIHQQQKKHYRVYFLGSKIVLASLARRKNFKWKPRTRVFFFQAQSLADP